jgi:hypothetical protein
MRAQRQPRKGILAMLSSCFQSVILSNAKDPGYAGTITEA